MISNQRSVSNYDEITAIDLEIPGFNQNEVIYVLTLSDH